MSLKYIVRRVLGKRGVRVLRWVLASIYRALRLVPPPDKYREFGVSAIVWSRNEEDWIEVSMRSIAEIVDEYVLIDASTDRTPEIAKDVGKELGIPVKIVKTFTTDMAEVGNLGLKHSSYRWILKWDPDFILHENFAPKLRKLIEDLDEERWYYAVYWPHVCLDGDLLHYNPRNYLHVEHWLYTYHPRLRYTYIDWLEHLELPAFYYRIDIETPMSIHLRTVKNPVRLLYRHYWYEIRRKGLLGKVDLESYVRNRIRDDFGTDDLVEAAKKYLENLLRGLAPYDPNKLLPYPSILRKYVKEKFGVELP